MATFTRSQSLLASVGAAALGGVALAALLAGSGLILADARATAVDSSLPLADAEFPICRAPAAAGRPNMMFRLAQTEVPRAEMSAASPAPAFADTEPPLWTGIGSITYKITTANERAQAYFDQGLRLAYAFNHGEAQRAFRAPEAIALRRHAKSCDGSSPFDRAIADTFAPPTNVCPTILAFSSSDHDRPTASAASP